MSTPPVLYEFPITTRMRLFLHFEHLIKTAETLINNGENPIEALRSLHELLDLLRYNDIKSELLRHIRWQEQELQKSHPGSAVDQEKLKRLVQEALQSLDNYVFPSKNYANNHLLNSLKLRLGVPGGTCSFDLPQMHAWLHFSSEARNSNMKDWLKPFLVMKKALDSSMSMTRMSDDFSGKTAKKGYYSNETSGKKAGYTIIRVMLRDNPSVYPEVSAGPQLFRIYFFEINNIEAQASQVQQDVQFELACCTL